MREAIFSRMRKQFDRPLYKVVMALLGLPTFIVGGISYYLYLKKERSERANFKRMATEQLKAEGCFEQVEQDCKAQVDRKFEFFGKNKNSREYEATLKKQIETETSRLVERQATTLMQEAGLSKPKRFMDYLTDCLRNPLLLVVSVITSLPLYVLMFICLNYFARYSFERIVMMIFVIFGVVLLVFTILHFSTFDAARSILGETATQEQVDSFNHTYGLDKPYISQLFNWFRKIITFDVGNSYSSNSSVLTELLRKFPTTLKLVFSAICIGMIVALPLGILASQKAGSGWDYVAMFIALILMSMPSFWIGMIMLLNLSIKAGWFPATFNTSNIVSYILPAVTMCLSLLAFTTRMTRSSMLEVSRQDYIVTARAKGLSNGRVVIRHMFRNALIPVITAASLQVGRMMGGSAVEERVYSVQGVGNYITSAVYIPDIPVVLTCVVYTSIIISLINLVVDLLYAVLDPGVKASLKKG